MKKVCAVIMAVIMMQAFSVLAFADSSFVSSPSGISAPTLTQISKETETCTAMVEVCAYGDRSKLENKMFAAMMTDAYEKISGSEDLEALDEEIEKLARELNVESDVFVASELFSLYLTGCDEHDAHGSIKVALEPTVLDNFAGLLKYNGVEWELVECERDEGVLLFDFDDDAVYTILLHDGTASGGNALTVVISVIAGVVVASILALLIISFIKKKDGEEAEAVEDTEE